MRNITTTVETIKKAGEAEQGAALATVSNRLAGTCLEQGRVSEAQEILWHACKLAERTRGKKDLAMGYCLGNLARFYQRQKEYGFAGFLYERAIQIILVVYRCQPAGTLRILQQYTQLLRETGRDEQASEMEQAFEALKQLPDHENG